MELFDIPEFPGYQASSNGDIVKIRNGKAKKQRQAMNGALQVDIGKTTRMVHDLVARAFYGPAPAGYRVKHRNGDPFDNRPGNLMWSGAPEVEIPDVYQLPKIPEEITREIARRDLERHELTILMRT